MQEDFVMHKSMRDVEGALRRCREDKDVCDANKALIASFAKDRLAKGIGRLRVAKCVYCLRFLARWLKKPYAAATKDDLIQLVGGLENMLW